jgi:hypothetical protein
MNSDTWDLMVGICEDPEVLQGLITRIAPIPLFTDRQEEEMIAYIDEAVQCHVIIPPRRHWDPKLINWTDITFGLIKAYKYMFDQVEFQSQEQPDSPSFSYHRMDKDYPNPT